LRSERILMEHALQPAVPLVGWGGHRRRCVGPLGLLENWDQLLEHEMVEAFFTGIMSHADKGGLLSREHFSVDDMRDPRLGHAQELRLRGWSDDPPAD
jgi:hypothetical protein